MDLGVISLKGGYSTLPGAPELKPHHQMQISVILKTPFWMEGLTPFAGDTACGCPNHGCYYSHNVFGGRLYSLAYFQISNSLRILNSLWQRSPPLKKDVVYNRQSVVAIITIVWVYQWIKGSSQTFRLKTYIKFKSNFFKITHKNNVKLFKKIVYIIKEKNQGMFIVWLNYEHDLRFTMKNIY